MPAHNAGESAGGAESSLPSRCSMLITAAMLPTAALNAYVLSDGNGQSVALLCRETARLERLPAVVLA